MLDPLTATIAATAALAGTGAAWRLHRRVRQVEAQAALLRQQLQAERRVACHDPLTGLLNRRAFFQLGATALAGRHQPRLVAVVIDIDHFKQINDERGHATGDEVLATVAGRLASFAGDDLVARLGGDEFAGLLTATATDSGEPGPPGHTAAAVTRALTAPVTVAGEQIEISVSVGVAAISPGTALTDALRHADTAMYRAKRQPRAARPDSSADWSTTIMPAPDTPPQQRDPKAVAPADSYHHADPVWVYRGEGWRAGVVEAASPQAVTVTYRPRNSRGTGVDTLTAPYLVAREDADPLLDPPPGTTRQV